MKDFLRYNMVTMNDWLKYHPYEKPSQADDYYQKLCNQLLKANINEPLLKDMNQLEYKELTCILVCWFEDVISETNIWRSFTAEHKKMYGKYLPFYNTDNDYYEDEINLQDIQFLIWHFFSMVENDIFISPYYPVFHSFASKVYALFETEYETAPPNQPFKKNLTIPDDRGFAETKKALYFLAINSYLNCLYARRILIKKYDKLNKSEHDNEHIEMLRMDMLFGVIIDNVSPILALRTNEQLANIMGQNHPKYDLIKNISNRYAITCSIKNINKDHWELEHISTSQRLIFEPETMSESMRKSQIKVNDFMFANLVKWGDEWVLMGMMFTYPGEKNTNSRIEHEKHVFDPIEPKNEILKNHEILFKELMEGSNLAYFKNTDDYDTFLNRINVLSYEKNNQGTPLPDDTSLKTNFGAEKMENLVVFFNPERGSELMTLFSSFIKDLRNPFYEKGKVADIQTLIINKSVSPQFVKYLIYNKLIDFDQNKEIDDITIIENLDFLLRYYKTDYY